MRVLMILASTQKEFKLFCNDLRGIFQFYHQSCGIFRSPCCIDEIFHSSCIDIRMFYVEASKEIIIKEFFMRTRTSVHVITRPE